MEEDEDEDGDGQKPPESTADSGLFIQPLLASLVPMI